PGRRYRQGRPARAAGQGHRAVHHQAGSRAGPGPCYQPGDPQGRWRIDLVQTESRGWRNLRFFAAGSGAEDRMGELTELVYLVDEEPPILKALGRLLKANGFETRSFL